MTEGGHPLSRGEKKQKQNIFFSLIRYPDRSKWIRSQRRHKSTGQMWQTCLAGVMCQELGTLFLHEPFRFRSFAEAVVCGETEVVKNVDGTPARISS